MMFFLAGFILVVTYTVLTGLTLILTGLIIVYFILRCLRRESPTLKKMLPVMIAVLLFCWLAFLFYGPLLCLFVED